MKFSETRNPAATGADYLSQSAGAIIADAFKIGFLFGRIPPSKKKAKRMKAEDAPNKYNVRLRDRYQACLRREFNEARLEKMYPNRRKEGENAWIGLTTRRSF